MANTVQVQFTVFQNLDSAGQKIGQERYGYRIFDLDDAQYNNTFDSLEQMQAAGLTQEGIYEYIEDKHPLFAEAAFYGGVCSMVSTSCHRILTMSKKGRYSHDDR